jgi:hypothetical protein
MTPPFVEKPTDSKKQTFFYAPSFLRVRHHKGSMLKNIIIHYMNKITALVILFLSIIIIISIFTNDVIFENMSHGRFMVVAAIINDESETTSNLEKVDALKKLNITDPKIKKILESTDTSNKEKIEKIKDLIKSVTF